MYRFRLCKGMYAGLRHQFRDDERHAVKGTLPTPDALMTLKQLYSRVYGKLGINEEFEEEHTED